MNLRLIALVCVFTAGCKSIPSYMHSQAAFQVVQLINTKNKRLYMTKKKQKPVILITNDDDITSPGIRNLVEAVKDLGKVVVVAPDKPQSGAWGMPSPSVHPYALTG